jgi:hypothetical protein
MPSLALTLANTSFDPAFSGNLNDLIAEYNSNLVAATATQYIMTGDVSSTSAPLTNVGPWMSPSTRAWYAWNGSAYAPAVVKVGTSAFQITFTTDTLSADRNIIFQDKDGVVSYLEDVLYGPGTKVLTGTEAMDCSLYSQFSQTAAVDRAHTITNFLPGQHITVAWTPTVANKVMTFTPAPIWQGGAAPATFTANRTTLYYLYNLGGVIYAAAAQEFY